MGSADGTPGRIRPMPMTAASRTTAEVRATIVRGRDPPPDAPALSPPLAFVARDPRTGVADRGARCAPPRGLRLLGGASVLVTLSPPPKLAFDFPGSVPLGQIVSLVVGPLAARQS